MTKDQLRHKVTKSVTGPTPRLAKLVAPARVSLLKRWRVKLELSQRSAADELGMSLRCYQELERGARFGTDEPMQADRRTMLAAAAILVGVEPLTPAMLAATRMRLTSRKGRP